MRPKVNIKNGTIMFVFTGDDCTAGTKYTVNIIMKCDYEAENNSHPELFSHVCIVYNHTYTHTHTHIYVYII